MFAERMKFLETSRIRKMFEMASQMKHPVNLSLGQPNFDVPDAVKEAAIQAIRDGKNGYTITTGLPELCEAISQDLKKKGVFAEAVISVSGASGGLVLALLALADESTEVLIPDPCFVSYGHMVRLTGAVPRFIDTYPDFRLTPEKLETAFQESLRNPKIKRRLLLFNTPVNPTGIAYTKDEIQNLAKTAKRLGMRVISDEVYEHFSYDFKHESWLKHDETALMVQTFGKTYGMTGWRSGFVAGPKEIIDQIKTLQQFTFVCTPHPVQWACLKALQTSVDHLIDDYRKKRNLVYEALKTAYAMPFPQGAFYAFPEIPDGDADRFMKKCLEKELLIVPGNAFSQKNTHFRVSFATDEETLKKGIDLLLKIATG